MIRNSFLVLLGAAAPALATQPLFLNNGSITNPQIDATAVVNNGTLSVSTSLPYDTANTLYYTNNLSGRMFGSVGFRFELVTNAFRLPAANVVNRGTIEATTHLLVTSTNITNTGSLSVGQQGLVRLQAKNADLRRGTITAGSAANQAVFDGFDFGNFYFNSSGVTDLYWGSGTNGVITNVITAGPGLNLLNFANYPFINTPAHQVIVPQGFRTFTGLPSGFFGREFTAHAYTNQVILGVSTQNFVQVVFVPSDIDPLLQTAVRFVPSFTGLSNSAIVEFSVPDIDPITSQPFTNHVYLIDDLAINPGSYQFLTNFNNGSTAYDTFKPEGYRIRRFTPFEWDFGVSNNTVFTPALLLGPPYATNPVNYAYLAYSAQIGANVSFSGVNSANATNAPGRVEITADTVDLTQARVRAETFIGINTTNLTGNSNALFDAPLVNFKFTTPNPTLVVDNFVASSVRRLQGTLSAWSGIWTNRDIFTGQNIVFHALVVDHNFEPEVPITYGSFNGTGNSIVIEDNVNPVLDLNVNAPAITVGTNGTLIFPMPDVGIAQLPTLRNLTNYGTISINNVAEFGSDAPQPYLNFVNHGNVSANSLHVRTGNLVNSSNLVAFLGPLSLSFGSAALGTRAATNGNGMLSCGGDIILAGHALTVTNTVINSLAALTLDLTNTLTDLGTNSANVFNTRDGIRIPTKPASGDLLGTTVNSTAGLLAAVSHTSAAEDRGASFTGFSNNVALGRLVLDGTNGSLFVFSPAGGTNRALYVDFLRFANSATNYLTSLQIDPGVTVYFADANLPVEKLDGAHGGRLRWVSSYAGAFSSVLFTNADSSVIVVNRSLRLSTTIDSDADGIPNRYDDTPFDPVSISLTLASAPAAAPGSSPDTAVISWMAAANTTYRIECRKTVSGPWQHVRDYTHGPANGTAAATDPIGPDGLCFYRVLYYR